MSKKLQRLAVVIAFVAVAAFGLLGTAMAAPRAKPCSIQLVRWEKVQTTSPQHFWRLWTPASCGTAVTQFSWIYSILHRSQIQIGYSHQRFPLLPAVAKLSVTLVVTPLGSSSSTRCSFTVMPARPPWRMALKNCP